MEDRIEYWRNVLENEQIEEGLEDSLLMDLQMVVDCPGELGSSELLDLLINSLPLVECPSIALDHILPLVRLLSPISVRAFKGLVLLHIEYSVSIPGIYSMLYSLITEDIFRVEGDLLVILLSDMLYSDSLSIQTIRAFLKRLSYLAVRVEISVSYKILNIISVISHKHKHSIMRVPRKESSTPSKVTIRSLVQIRKIDRNNPSVETERVSSACSPFSLDSSMNDTAVDWYLYELDLLKDHPVLNVYAREIKQNRIVDIKEEEINRRVLELLN